MLYRPSIQEIREALMPLIHIPRPDGDNEGDPINGDTVLPYLSPKHQEQARQAAELVHEYARTLDGQVNRRALTTLVKDGFRASLNPSQYNPERLVGYVTVGEWEINISDPGREED